MTNVMSQESLKELTNLLNGLKSGSDPSLREKLANSVLDVEKKIVTDGLVNREHTPSAQSSVSQASPSPENVIQMVKSASEVFSSEGVKGNTETPLHEVFQAALEKGIANYNPAESKHITISRQLMNELESMVVKRTDTMVDVMQRLHLHMEALRSENEALKARMDSLNMALKTTAEQMVSEMLRRLPAGMVSAQVGYGGYMSSVAPQYQNPVPNSDEARVHHIASLVSGGGFNG